jgi:uncharacterized damage-inducible protein DinB
MASPTSGVTSADFAGELSPKDRFLEEFENEHQTTLRVLRAYPIDQLEMKPHPTSRSARELAWVFVLERFLGQMVFKDEFIEKAGGETPEPPESWDELIATFEQAHSDYGELIRSTPEREMIVTVRFFTGPGTVGTYTRLEWLWFLHHDEIHHRGQFSVYLRMAGGKVPSIYGPSSDEPWM